LFTLKTTKDGHQLAKWCCKKSQFAWPQKVDNFEALACLGTLRKRLEWEKKPAKQWLEYMRPQNSTNFINEKICIFTILFWEN